jgi:hypothetical protein
MLIHPKRVTAMLLMALLALSCWMAPAWAALNPTGVSADRAVEIARQARDRVERSGKSLQGSSQSLFKEFAERTVELQKLLDARRQLEESGLLAKGDPDGDARRAHINGQILIEVGELKKACDRHLTGMLAALEHFDRAVADSLVDSQATRSINSNYELALDQYLQKGQSHYQDAAGDAETALQAYQNASDERVKSRMLKRYQRAKQRLQQIAQRRQLYQARLQAAAMNQQISGMIREKIRLEGSDIPTRFREVMAAIYNTFAKITPIAELGGTGTPELLGNLGFANLSEVRETLDLVDGAIGKLGTVLDDMVNDVMAGLGEIRVVGDSGGSSGASFSVEEEMEFLRSQRDAWQG